MLMSEDKKKRVTPKTSYYAIRTVAGQEINVALLIENRVRNFNIDVKSIVVPPRVKGYVILEAPGLHVVYNVVREMKHVKGQAPGKIDDRDVKEILVPKPVILGLNEGDTVEIIGGPFKGMRAKVLRVEVGRNEVVLNILESDYPLQITVPGDYVRLVRKAGESE